MKKEHVFKFLHRSTGFTLVEVLVVVLIVGILTAIALPKYRKSIQMARATEIATNLKALKLAINAFVDEKGMQTGRFLGSGKTKTLSINLSLPDCTNSTTSVCSENYSYSASCHGNICEIVVADRKGGFMLTADRGMSSHKWDIDCEPKTHPACRFLDPE